MRKGQSFGISLRVLVSALTVFVFLSPAYAQQQPPKADVSLLRIYD